MRLLALALALLVHGVALTAVLLFQPQGRTSLFDQPVLLLQLGQGSAKSSGGLAVDKNVSRQVSRGRAETQLNSQNQHPQSFPQVISLGSFSSPPASIEPVERQVEGLNRSGGEKESEAEQGDGRIFPRGSLGEGLNGPGGIHEASFGAGDGPGFLTQGQLSYPMVARRAGREGLVVLSLNIDRTGRLQGVVVIQSAGHGMDEEAINMVRRSTFRPALRDGAPVACLGHLPVRFKLIPN